MRRLPLVLGKLYERLEVTEPPDAPGGRWQYFSPQWWAIIQSLLDFLDEPDVWASDQDQAVQWVINLMSSVPTAPHEMSVLCSTFQTHQQVITWYPLNPYQQKTEILFPFQAPLWTRGEESVLSGAKTGDVFFTFAAVVDSFNPFDLARAIIDNFGQWLGSPFEDPENRIPRFRVDFTGAGEVELHLLKVPQGGLALISLDDKPVDIVDCQGISAGDVNSWLALLSVVASGVIASVSNSFIEETIYEVKATTPGAHHIDVTFLPKFSGSFLLGIIPEAGWGGGLRSVVMCGQTRIARGKTPPQTAGTVTEQDLAPIYQEWTTTTEVFIEQFFQEFNIMPSNCGCGGMNTLQPVFYCEGKLYYRDADSGQLVPVDYAALPTNEPSEEGLPENPTNHEACQKAWAAAEVATLVWRATLDTLVNAGSVQLSAYYAYWQQNHSEVNADNYRMNQIIGGLFDLAAQQEWNVSALEQDYLLTEAEYRQQFMCEQLATMPITGNIGDNDINRIQASELAYVLNPDLKTIMFAALSIPETAMWKQFGYQSLLASDRVCNCQSSPDPITDDDWEEVFDFATLVSLLGFETYEWAGFLYTPPTPSVDGTGIVAVHGQVQDISRKGIWLVFNGMTPDDTTRIKQIKVEWAGGSTSTNSNETPHRVIRARVMSGQDNTGDILFNGAADTFNVPSGQATFTGLADSIPATASLLLNMQIGYRNPWDDIAADGMVKIAKLTITGDGTNPF